MTFKFCLKLCSQPLNLSIFDRYGHKYFSSSFCMGLGKYLRQLSNTHTVSFGTLVTFSLLTLLAKLSSKHTVLALFFTSLYFCYAYPPKSFLGQAYRVSNKVSSLTELKLYYTKIIHSSIE